MILIDTNIVSEMMKAIPSPEVVHWFDQQDVTQLYVTAITIAEISYGLHSLPNSKRRRGLEEAFDRTIQEAFQQRIVAFDEAAVFCYGKIMSQRKASGRPLTVLDGQIAAIARAHALSVATRNTKDFQGCDIVLVNPFAAT